MYFSLDIDFEPAVWKKNHDIGKIARTINKLWSYMEILANTDSGNDLLPNSINPLSEQWLYIINEIICHSFCGDIHVNTYNL